MGWSVWRSDGEPGRGGGGAEAGRGVAGEASGEPAITPPPLKTMENQIK